MSYDHENTMKMTEEKATVNINIHGGNNQILPNATHAEQHFHEVGKVENNYTTTIEIHLNATINLNGKISPKKRRYLHPSPKIPSSAHEDTFKSPRRYLHKNGRIFSQIRPIRNPLSFSLIHISYESTYSPNHHQGR